MNRLKWIVAASLAGVICVALIYGIKHLWLEALEAIDPRFPQARVASLAYLLAVGGYVAISAALMLIASWILHNSEAMEKSRKWVIWFAVLSPIVLVATSQKLWWSPNETWLALYKGVIGGVMGGSAALFGVGATRAIGRKLGLSDA